MPAFPVDTHVHRVTGRLGLRGPKVSAEKAHAVLEASAFLAYFKDGGSFKLRVEWSPNWANEHLNTTFKVRLSNRGKGMRPVQIQSLWKGGGFNAAYNDDKLPVDFTPPANAAKGYRLEDIPFDENRQIFEVNTLGLFLVTQVFGSRMVEAGRGSIINIGSLYAGVSPDERFYDHIQSDPPFLKPPAYGASKAAVISLTKYLATLWAPHGVRVNALSPGGVAGGQDEEFQRKFCNRVPMGRMATAADLRGPLIFLASQASSYVTGIELLADGGFTAW